MKTTIFIMTVTAALTFELAAAEQKVDFAKEVQPILQQKCVKCHGPDKQKGKLRLDSKEAAMKGGEDGAVIAPGHADKSDLYRRITLPKGNDDVMPNEGELLSKAQTDLIRDWINQGANWPETVAAKEAGHSPSPLDGLPAGFKPSAAEQKAIAQFAQLGLDIRPVAMNVPWREANFRLAPTNVTDAMLAPLKDVASLVELNLAATKITDAGLVHLKGLANLTRLHLELTKITDAGLAHLKGFKNLSYLNLYATAVTDAGLEHLKDLRNLKELYLWQTKVTTNGVAALQKALPNLQISTGWDISNLVKKPEADDAKKN